MSTDLVLSKELTTSQQLFCELLAGGTEKHEAAKQAGYGTGNPFAEASRLLQQPQIIAAVQIGVAKRLAVGSGVALRVLQEFTADEQLDKRLRFACAKTLLDRAGHIAPKAAAVVQTGETPLNEMSMTDLRALADKLQGEIAGRAKEVKSAKPAPVKAQAFEDLV